jgi:hypothetical protein
MFRSRNVQGTVATVLIGAMLAGGCTTMRVAAVSRMEAPTTQRSQPVRYDGEYVAMWTPSDKKHLQPIAGSARYAHEGERLGFEYSDSGQLIGLHDDARVLLTDLPDGTHYVVWQNRQTRKTQFGREVDKAMAGTVTTLQVAGVTALIVGGTAALGYYVYKHPQEAVDSFFNSDDDE